MPILGFKSKERYFECKTWQTLERLQKHGANSLKVAKGVGRV
jgi:hypothetical protein